jgi:hypothetical protein
MKVLHPHGDRKDHKGADRPPIPDSSNSESVLATFAIFVCKSDQKRPFTHGDRKDHKGTGPATDRSLLQFQIRLSDLCDLRV